MKILTKKIATLLLLFVFATCIGFGLLTMSKTSANEGAPESPTVTDFSTTEGVWIRENDPTGIRFGATISAAYYNSLTSYYDRVELGMAIARRDSIATLKTEAEGTITDADPDNDGNILKAKDENSWANDKNPVLGTADYEYYFTIKELQYSNYNVKYTALAYAKVTKGEDTSLIWSYVSNDTATTRTAAQAAASYIATGVQETTFATAIINQVLTDGAEFKFVNENYTLNATSTVVPKVTLGGVEVKAKFASSNTDKVTFDENGNFVAKGKCSGVTVTATIEGTNATATATVGVEMLIAESVIDNSGILTLGVNNETASITVLDGEETLLTKTGVTTATYDIYNDIIEARIAAGTTAAKSYTVNIVTENYAGTVTTAEITAVTDQTSLRAVAGHTEEDSEDIYAYLANSVTLDGTGLDTIFGQPIMISNSADNVATDGKQVFLNLDGRGYTISASVGQAGASNYGILIFHYLKNSNIKNVMFDYSVTATNSVGMLAYNITNTDFTNCYFKFISNLSNAVSPIASTISMSNFNNCIFELVDANTTDTFGMTIANGDVPNTYISNSVIISNTADEGNYQTKLFESGKTIPTCSNVKVFDSVATLVSSAGNYADLGSAWDFTDAYYIKLQGQNVRRYAFETKDTAIDAAGIMTLATEGELTDINLYAEDGTTFITTLATGVTGETYDVYDAIISYREGATITANAKYVVKAESENIIATASTATIKAIAGSVSALKAVIASANYTTEYYYLTANITEVPSTSLGTGNAEAYIGYQNTVARFARINLDGRGYTISYVKTDKDTALYPMFGAILNSNIKNVNFDFDVVGTGNASYLLCGILQNSTITNCYFDVKASVVNASSTAQNVSLYNGVDSGYPVTHEFVSCVFDIENSTNVGISIVNGQRTKLTNCVLVHPTAGNMNAVLNTFAPTVDSSGNIVHNSLSSAITNANTKNALNTSAWTFTSTEIKLCGKTVASKA